MSSSHLRFATGALILAALAPLIAYQISGQQPRPHLTDPFVTGWMLTDTNGDEIADFIAGKIVVPANPSAEQNAAAANIAARLGYGTTAFTPPVVITAAADRIRWPADLHRPRSRAHPVLRRGR